MERHPQPNIFDMDKRLALLEQSHQSTQAELHAINANTSKLVWIVMTAVVLGMLNLIFKAV